MGSFTWFAILRNSKLDTASSVSILFQVVNPSVLPGHGTDHLRLRAQCTFIAVKALNTTALTITLLNLTGRFTQRGKGFVRLKWLATLEFMLILSAWTLVSDRQFFYSGSSFSLFWEDFGNWFWGFFSGMALDNWMRVKKPSLHPAWFSRRRSQYMVSTFLSFQVPKSRAVSDPERPRFSRSFLHASGRNE